VLSLALSLAATSTQAQAQWRLTDAQGHPLKPGLNTASQGDFGTQEIATTDPEALQRAWAQPTPGVEIATQESATRNQPISIFVIFRGCQADADGNCHVTTRFETFDPAGKPYGAPAEGPVWDGPPPPPGNLQLSHSGMGLRIEDGEQLGKYRVIARTTDHVANISLATELTLTFSETPRTGGWSAVAAPDGDRDVRAAAAAVMAYLPAGHATLAKVDIALRQVVAGNNYRLTLRLADGNKWSAFVWHKLDGSFAVSGVAQVR
jgi:hypothetical protein